MPIDNLILQLFYNDFVDTLRLLLTPPLAYPVFFWKFWKHPSAHCDCKTQNKQTVEETISKHGECQNEGKVVSQEGSFIWWRLFYKKCAMRVLCVNAQLAGCYAHCASGFSGASTADPTYRQQDCTSWLQKQQVKSLTAFYLIFEFVRDHSTDSKVFYYLASLVYNLVPPEVIHI